ncbi:unnamed protein product [Ranitomeya imitator]|uniref:Uncharacterized protein n=1 Tax=Ranitomeya imitator TaxID=111125 RepID=A0ABN9LBU1_9NEOB|nr:unnamed protein product [Ranitomeya imitator]
MQLSAGRTRAGMQAPSPGVRRTQQGQQLTWTRRQQEERQEQEPRSNTEACFTQLSSYLTFQRLFPTMSEVKKQQKKCPEPCPPPCPEPCPKPCQEPCPKPKCQDPCKDQKCPDQKWCPQDPCKPQC